MGKRGSSKRRIKKSRDNELKRLNSGRVANEELGAAMRGLRGSNAAVPHVPVFKKGTRGVKNRDAVKDFD